MIQLHPPFVAGPASVQVQSVLYNVDVATVRKVLTSIARATEIAATEGCTRAVTVAYGDCSGLPCLEPAHVEALRQEFSHAISLSYDFFGENLGSARGHNRLAANVETDFILVQNPDVIVSPRLLQVMLAGFQKSGVGVMEAKQLPIEHPKDYDRVTGVTSWATTACALIPTALFREVGGFDAENFFLYCDDVDFSWRVRLLSYNVVFQPAAVVFHDKRLSDDGQWQPSAAERYYSAEAALLLAHKWGRPDGCEDILAYFRNHGDDNHKRAAAVFERRRNDGTLPRTIQDSSRVAEFYGIYYAKHRFML